MIKVSNEVKVKIWLMPVPLMALIGILIGLIYFDNILSLVFGIGIGVILMFPFMWKYGEMYNKLDW